MYKIVSRHARFASVFDANPNFFLEVSDVLFGKDRPRVGAFARYRYWHEAFVPRYQAPRNMLPGTNLPRTLNEHDKMNVSPHDAFWNTSTESSDTDESMNVATDNN